LYSKRKNSAAGKGKADDFYGKSMNLMEKKGFSPSIRRLSGRIDGRFFISVTFQKDLLF
jgi:hypothetical protein